MKEIKDYLHLYIKCWGLLTRGTDEFHHKHYENGEWVLSGTLYQEIMMYKHEFKPILRPLSDMTEEEALECWEVCEGASGHNYGVTNPKCALTDTTFHANLSPDQWFKATKYLLSKHFDLFGLIEAGLAIDKTTLQ